jgi:hypothetical protein
LTNRLSGFKIAAGETQYGFWFGDMRNVPAKVDVEANGLEAGVLGVRVAVLRPNKHRELYQPDAFQDVD